jgi:hypothetical protein
MKKWPAHLRKRKKNKKTPRKTFETKIGKIYSARRLNLLAAAPLLAVFFFLASSSSSLSHSVVKVCVPALEI